MFAAIARAARFAKALVREHLSKPGERSPHWPAVRRAHLKAHPTCAACGARAVLGMQVHHEKPFHLDPELELDPKNLITLCERLTGPECHLRIGHGGSFQLYNPHVRLDAAEALVHPERRPAIEERALDSRRSA